MTAEVIAGRRTQAHGQAPDPCIFAVYECLHRVDSAQQTSDLVRSHFLRRCQHAMTYPHRGGGYKSGVNHMHIDSQSLPASSRKQSPRLILALRKKELAASGRDAEDRQRRSTRCAGQWELAAMCAEYFTSLRTRWGARLEVRRAVNVCVRVKYVAEGVWHRPHVGAQSHFLC